MNGPPYRPRHFIFSRERGGFLGIMHLTMGAGAILKESAVE